MILAKTFEAEVEGLGLFTFRKRTMRDQTSIEAEQHKILRGITDSPALENTAHMIAVLTIQTITAPKDWDLEALDPLDDGDWKLLRSVWEAFRKAEERFRKGPAADGASPGA